MLRWQERNRCPRERVAEEEQNLKGNDHNDILAQSNRNQETADVTVDENNSRGSSETKSKQRENGW